VFLDVQLKKQQHLLLIYGGDILELPKDILLEFANQVQAPVGVKKETVLYGTVVDDGEKTYVRVDGTDELTPVSVAMDAKNGDRVVMSIQNHTAIITGNISSPASARTATNYMNLTEEGLVIGNLDANSEPVGTSSLVAPGVYYIVDQNGVKVASFSSAEIMIGNGAGSFKSDSVSIGKGAAVFKTDEVSIGNGTAIFKPTEISLSNGTSIFKTDEVSLNNGTAIFKGDLVSLGNGAATFTPEAIAFGNGLASFSPSLVKLGKDGSSEVSFCDGKGSIKFVDNTMRLQSSNTVGLRSNYEEIYPGRYIATRADVVCINGSSPKAVMQAYANEDGVVGGASIEVGIGYINLNSPQNSLGDTPVRINGNEVLHSGNFMITGSIKGYGSIPPNDAKTIIADIPVPDGFILCGIQEITTNHDHLCHLTEFKVDPTNKRIEVTLYNTHATDTQSMTVWIRWFGFRVSEPNNQGEIIINW
jgi:hypothetical protein